MKIEHKKTNEMWSFDRAWARENVYQQIENLGLPELPPLPKGISIHTDTPGFYFGEFMDDKHADHYVGALLGFEGNVAVIGSNGSGKSSCIAQPTIARWTGSLCVVDVKGEHTECYSRLYTQGLVDRPFIVWDPLNPESPAFDPFWWLLHDSEENLSSNIDEMAHIIIPAADHTENPFWHEAERDILAASLLFFFKQGLSFSQAISQILATSLKELCRNLENIGDFDVRLRIGKSKDISSDTLSSLERGLRNKLRLFAADPFISHTFRGKREGAQCFTWEDLDNYQIFLKIPEHRIDQWSNAIRLLCTQLIRFLERRPEKHSAAGREKLPVLLLLDEFARFGRMDCIASALATLRSKQVNICIFVQSIAQLDKIYGAEERRVIFDNCQMRAILRATDPDTQKYLAAMIGTHLSIQTGSSKSFDNDHEQVGAVLQQHIEREFVVQPHELSLLEDIILLTPSGYIRVEKQRIDFEKLQKIRKAKNKNKDVILCNVKETQKSDGDSAILKVEGISAIRAEAGPFGMMGNPGAKVLSIGERHQDACKVLQKALGQPEENRTNLNLGQTESDRNAYIGMLLLKAFPEFLSLKTGKGMVLERNLLPVEEFLSVLSSDREAVMQLADLAGCSKLFGKS